MPSARQILIDLTILIVIGVAMALIGPFGSFRASFAWRLVYWCGVIVAGYAFYRPAGSIAAWLSPRLQVPEWTMWVAACVVGTVPMSAVVWLTGWHGGTLRMPSLEEAVALYGQVLVIGTIVTMIFFLIAQQQRARRALAGVDIEASPVAAPVPASPAPPSGPTAPFLDRLPPRLGRVLIALEMEDHYVRAHTASGSDLILMRMRDAVAELDGMDGAQVHRSWWVARAAVTGVRREGRNLRLTLTGGLEAPVARGKAAELEAAGWF
ncbi:LytTR family DNA-binding domain-containing protein [Sphingomonas sp. FW199]|uniref:LytTR family DNA-binding domain-containing protein n=1 Tax=Sphingomonas sp. FW199 TaxID=3400217 RepID=UPI003CF9B317